MSTRVRRTVSVGLSVAVHALLLLELTTVALIQPGFPEQRLLPVRIIQPPPPKPRPARQPPPPQAAAKPPEAAKPIEEPPPQVPAPEPPQRKLPLPEQQIVSVPDAGKNEAPPETRLLSDRDNRVDQQTVKRGNPKPGDEAPEKAPAEQPKQQPPKQAKAAERRGGGQTDRQPPPRVASLPGLDRLMPDALRLAEEGYGKEANVPPGEQLAQADEARRVVQPRRSDGLWIPSSGPIGTLDFLPDVREGDITLLNTKAEVFAPFVRRVATRVFQNFWISLKRDLVASALATTEHVEAEAVMNPAGEMVGFEIHKRSARIALASDRRLQQACNDGFFDRNPPPAARTKDGNIHFVFITSVQSSPSPRGTAYWIQLEAGLL
jgi:hypothetical protein